MCNGYKIYQGDPQEIPSRLQKLNIEVPRFTSFTDYFMRIIDKDEIQVECELSLKENEILDTLDVDERFKERIGSLLKLQNEEEEQTKILQTSKSKNFSLKGQLTNIKDYKLDEPLLSKEKLSTVSSNISNSMKFLDMEAAYRNKKRGILGQIITLTWMKMAFHYKQPIIYAMLFGQLVVGNFLFFILYHDLGDPEDDTIVAIQNRMGLCYMMVTQGTFSGLGSSLLNFMTQKKLFKKDKDSRLYDEFPFYFAEFFYLMPMYIVIFGLVVVLYYTCLNLNTEPSVLLNAGYTYFFIFVGSFLSGQSFSAVIGSLADTMATAAIVAPLIIAPLSMSSGYLANLRTAKLPIRIISYVSSIRFSFQGFALTEFQNSEKYTSSCFTYIPCPDDISKRCKVKLPMKMRAKCDPMQVTDFIQDDILVNIYYLVCIMLVLRIVSFIIFKIKSTFGKMRYKKNYYLRKKYQSINFDK